MQQLENARLLLLLLYLPTSRRKSFERAKKKKLTNFQIILSKLNLNLFNFLSFHLCDILLLFFCFEWLYKILFQNWHLLHVSQQTKTHNAGAPLKDYKFVFFLNGPTLASFTFYFQYFQTNNTIFTTNQCEKMSKCASCIRHQDSNPQPFEHESSPITTRPGLSHKIIKLLQCSHELMIFYRY